MPPLVTIGRAARKQKKQAQATKIGRRDFVAAQYRGLRSTIIVHIPSTATYLKSNVNKRWF